MRQPLRWTRMPPSVGPIAIAVEAIAVQMPIAQAFCFGSGNAAETSASEVTLTVAAATPWIARAALRTSSEPREAAGDRGEREERDAGDVELAPAVHVGEGPGRHDRYRHPEAVRRDDPLQPRLADLEIVLDRRQRHVHDQRVEEDHEQAEARRGEGHALDAGHGSAGGENLTGVPQIEPFASAGSYCSPDTLTRALAFETFRRPGRGRPRLNLLRSRVWARDSGPAAHGQRQASTHAPPRHARDPSTDTLPDAHQSSLDADAGPGRAGLRDR